MGSGSYSFAVYASLASDRGYATKSADAVFTNHSLSAKSDLILPDMVMVQFLPLSLLGKWKTLIISSTSFKELLEL